MPRSSSHALSEEAFKKDKLENAAINQAFMTASYYKDDRASYAKSYFDHPAISAKDYYDALYRFLQQWRSS